MAQYPQNVNNCQSLKVQSIEKKMFMKKYWGMLFHYNIMTLIHMVLPYWYDVIACFAYIIIKWISYMYIVFIIYYHFHEKKSFTELCSNN